jgi:hypothetical protein
MLKITVSFGPATLRDGPLAVFCALIMMFAGTAKDAALS